MIKNSHSIAVVIPAAGVGSRMQSNIPKQYINLNGKTILQHTIDKLSQVAGVEHIVVVVSENDEWFSEQAPKHITMHRVSGGKERADSVLNGLTYVKAHRLGEWALVHDAARPLVTKHDINALIQSAFDNDTGAILASKVKDTIKQGDITIEKTVPRARLWQALTPQLFPVIDLIDALNKALSEGAEITDEASAIEYCKGQVLLVEGRGDNFKITTNDDLLMAQLLLTHQLEGEKS